MNKALRIFTYRGYTAAQADIAGEGILNDPKAAGQLGFVVRADHTYIDKESIEVLKKLPREGGSFATLMLTKHDESIVAESGAGSIGLLGGRALLKTPDRTEGIGRTCDLSVLDLAIVEEDLAPYEFKVAVDGWIKAAEAKKA